MFAVSDFCLFLHPIQCYYHSQHQLSSKQVWFIVLLKGNDFKRPTYLLSCQQLNEKIDDIVINR